LPIDYEIYKFLLNVRGQMTVARTTVQGRYREMLYTVDWQNIFLGRYLIIEELAHQHMQLKAVVN